MQSEDKPELEKRFVTRDCLKVYTQDSSAIAGRLGDAGKISLNNCSYLMSTCNIKFKEKPFALLQVCFKQITLNAESPLLRSASPTCHVPVAQARPELLG